MNQYVTLPATRAQMAGVIALAVVAIIGYKLIANRIVPASLKF